MVWCVSVIEWADKYAKMPINMRNNLCKVKWNIKTILHSKWEKERDIFISNGTCLCEMGKSYLPHISCFVCHFTAVSMAVNMFTRAIDFLVVFSLRFFCMLPLIPPKFDISHFCVAFCFSIENEMQTHAHVLHRETRKTPWDANEDDLNQILG